jgi:hypothetical protein
VLSGFAIWKPVQLHWLAVLMGGYDGARVIHFLALLGLIGFVVMHVVMVIVHYKQFPEMITGGKLESVDAWAEPPAVGKPRSASPRSRRRSSRSPSPSRCRRRSRTCRR